MVLDPEYDIGADALEADRCDIDALNADRRFGEQLIAACGGNYRSDEKSQGWEAQRAPTIDAEKSSWQPGKS